MPQLLTGRLRSQQAGRSSTRSYGAYGTRVLTEGSKSIESPGRCLHYEDGQVLGALSYLPMTTSPPLILATVCCSFAFHRDFCLNILSLPVCRISCGCPAPLDSGYLLHSAMTAWSAAPLPCQG